MFDLGPASLGITLVVLGLAFFGLTPLILRVVPKLRPIDTSPAPPPRPMLTNLDLQANQEAVILVEPGGRVYYTNEITREWFGLKPNEYANLEQMARITRPGETFLQLCAIPGRAHFTVQKFLVEGTSFAIPYDGGHAVLVTLRRPQLFDLDESKTGNAPSQAWSLLAEITQNISASLDLDQTITTILENVDRVVQSDFSEVTLWNPETGQLTPYRYMGKNAEPASLEKGRDRFNVSHGYSGQLITERKPLLIRDIDELQPADRRAEPVNFPFRSYLGIPLIVGGKQIGTLELASQSANTFNDEDLELLKMLSGQISVSLQNSIAHYEEQQRVAEISGLAELARVGSSLRDERELFERLTQNIATLMDVEVIGFLLYDEAHRTLRGQVPFIGMPPQFVELYQAYIEPDSIAERIWLSQDVLYTPHAGEDSALSELGLAHLAHAAGVVDTALLPLAIGGRPLGYMQIANKRDGNPIDEDDMRLLTIVAGQAAPIIENATLVRDARRRTQRAETLRRIASLAGSDATLDEILKFSLLEVARFFQADQVMIYMLDDTTGEMRLHRDSMMGIEPEVADRFSRMPANDERFKETPTATSIPVLWGDVSSEPVPEFYQAFIDSFPLLHAMMVVPLVIRDRGIGEIIVSHENTNFFENYDIQTLGTVASQLASAVERSTLYAQTDDILQRRVEHLTALSRVSRELNTTLQLNHLLQRVYDEAVRATGADGGTILLFEVDPDNPSERRVMLNLGQIASDELSPLEQTVLDRGEPIIIKDFQTTAFLPIRENNRSALVVPIAYQDDVAGLIHLYSRRPEHFDNISQEITQALAIQAAIALGNAQRYQDMVNRSEMLYRRVEVLNNLFETTQAIDLDMPLEEALEIIAFGIQESNLFEVALIFVFDSSYDVLRLVTGAGLPLPTLAEIREVIVPWSDVKQLLDPDFKLSNSYFVSAHRHPEVPPLVPRYAVFNYSEATDPSHAWQPGDSLIVPLMDTKGQPLGVIALDAPRNGNRPDNLTIETLEIYATEASLVLSSERRLVELRKEVGSIESEIARAEQAGQVAQEHLSVLLSKDLDQTIAIQQLYDRARNIRVGLDIAETINRQPDRSAVLNSLGHELLTKMDLDIALIVEQASSGPRLLQQMGNLPESANPQALLGQRNPLRQTLQTGEPVLVANLEESEDWQSAPLLKSLNAKGFISLPISTNGHIDAAVLAISLTPLSEFSIEDRQIFDLIGDQVAIALQNLNLLTETRRRLREVNLLLEFSQQLGALEESQILGTLVESARKALSHTHAGFVSVWSEEEKTLITRAASGYSDNEKIAQITFGANEALPGEVYTSGQPQRVAEVDFARQYNLKPEKLLLYREATGGRLPVSSMLIPIRTAENVLGVLTLDNFNAVSAFTQDDEALVMSLTQQTALTLDNVRLFEETRQLNEELEQRVQERTEELAQEHFFSQTLLKISTELSASLDLDHVLNRSLQMLNNVLGAEQSSIIIVRPGDEHLYYRAGVGITGSVPIGGRESSYKVGEGLAGWVIENREPLIINDLTNDERWIADRGEISVHQSAMVVPLSVGEDALGALMLYHREKNQFSRLQIDATQAAANQFAVAINNGELFRLIRDQAEDLGTMLRAQQVEASRSTAMLEGVADGVLVTDNNNIITLFNDGAQSILEMSAEQVIGKSLDAFLGLFGGAAQSWIETIRKWSEDPTSREEHQMYSERITLEDGRVVSVHLAPVSAPNEFLGTVSIFRDITHQVEVDRLKSEFVATVSHELRTPMTPIKGYVEFLMMGGAGELNEQQSQFLEIIKSNIDRLSILVNDLLDVSRIEAGKLALSMQPLNMAEIVEEIFENVQRKSREENKPMNFSVDAAKDTPNAYGDPERIYQVINNLVDNAYRYTPANGKVEIHIRGVEGHVQVDIKDNGVGIFPDDQQRIFDRFYRGENEFVMATSGTGLGLAIVKEIIEMHNGRIWVESPGAPGSGSTFSFLLPAYQAEEEQDMSKE